MKQICQFLQQLADNNNRDWFNANKSLYQELQSRFHTLAEELIAAIASWDDDIAASNLTVKDCTYRIYRDTRFSKNKAPYKTHMGIYICKGGKKAPYAGYYFHLEPEFLGPDSFNENHLSIGGCALIAGTYHFENKILRSIRDEISVNGESFVGAIKEAEGFEFFEGDMLKKVPSEFAFAPQEFHYLLKQKEFALCKFIDKVYLSSPNLAMRISEDFRKTENFIRKINLAVDFALEEM